MNIEKNKNAKNSKVYLIGSGIASLAGAVYLEKDAGILGENIYILEKDHILGGALDGAGGVFQDSCRLKFKFMPPRSSHFPG